MIRKFTNDLERRRNEILKFYYLEIGSLIRKKRIELKLTQEELSRGIISHTYLSKIEHNSISVNQDSLFMIMERIDMSSDEYGLPEEMLRIIEESLSYFFHFDIEKYEALYFDTLKYEYGILIDISRFGYYVLTQDIDNAKVSYDELHRYLCSVEDYGFTIYAIFAIYYNILVNDYVTAKDIYEQAIDYHSMSEEIYGLFEYAKFIIYGKLHLFNLSRDGYESSKNIFISNGSTTRLQEMGLYLNLFRMYENSEPTIPVQNTCLRMTDKNCYEECLIMLADINNDNPLPYLKQLSDDSKYYPYGLYLQISHYKKIGESELADTYLKRLKEYYVNNPIYEINCYEMYILKNKSDFLYKEFLIDVVYPFASSIQNIYLLRKITTRIVEILQNHKRYKDAISYENKFQKQFEKMREKKVIESKTDLLD